MDKDKLSALRKVLKNLISMNEKLNKGLSDKEDLSYIVKDMVKEYEQFKDLLSDFDDISVLVDDGEIYALVLELFRYIELNKSLLDFVMEDFNLFLDLIDLRGKKSKIIDFKG